jgi:phosphopantothenoylcysteine decarboxylase
MPNILLGVTGSVAAIRVPELYAALRARGWTVKIVATRAATYFFDTARIEPADPAIAQRNPDAVILDEDEWPGRDAGHRWERGEPVQHIELRRWADLFLIAPLDANTLAKLAGGLCDNCLTCVWRAWDPARPVVLAPAMNTLMWQHPITRRHLRQIALNAGLASVPDHLDEMAATAAINEQCPLLRIIPPQVKTLACGDEGIGGMAEIAEIVAAVGDRLRSHGENQEVE